jgi:hypothetical protein
MKLIFSLLFTLFFSTNILAQKTISTNKNAFAYYKAHLPGMIKFEDENNKIPPKINIERFIYIECKIKSKPLIEKVLYNNKELKITESVLVGPKVNIGLKTNAEFPTILKASKNKIFWILKLENKSVSEKDFGKNINKIKITYTVEKVFGTILLNEETELLTPEAQ